MAEQDATGGSRLGGLGGGFPSQKKLSAMADINVKGLDDFASSLSKVKTNLAELQQTLRTFSSSSNAFKSEMDKIAGSLKGVSASAKDVSGAVQGISAGSSGSKSPRFTAIKTIFTPTVDGGGGVSSSAASSSGRKTTNIKSNAGATESDISAGKSMGSDTGEAIKSLLGSVRNGLTSLFSGGIGGVIGGGISTALKAAGGVGTLGGIVNAGSLNYAYDRIEGPTGNRNTALQLSQALGPNAAAMGMSIQDLIRGLAQGAPVRGSNADIVSTVLAGQSVGSYMKGTSGRNGFFESVRQMQTLTPGVSAGAMSSTLANYIGNTKSQQAGMYYGQGAFTMIGQGGRYKSLAEWAEGITKFMEQQRVGNQGGKFSKDELITQNFPGSNINAWFQMMGVPGEMVDYWWQYALANAGQVSPITQGAAGQTKQLAANVSANKGNGIDLASERLRNITESSRRDYLLGNQMYNIYGGREAADRRFNIGMQGADLSLAKTMTGTNLGNIMSMLPTPIAEMLMPIISSLVSTPFAGLMTGNHMLAGLKPTGDPIGDPIGDYGPRGGTSTKHLAPDLGSKIDAMMKANPRLKMSSGYRDTVTQNRLHRNGVGRVGPASKSMHTRGWAADIGPMSEMGWLQANAGKFGLQTATHAGEPWHVQAAGTMPYGDPGSMPIGDEDSFLGKVGAFFGTGAKALEDTITWPMKKLISMFFSGGSAINTVDSAINFFIKLLMEPMGMLGSFTGTNKLGVDDYKSLINTKSDFKSRVFKGFEPDVNLGQPVFGDPISMASGSPTIHAKMDSPIIFKTEIHLNGATGNSPIDAQRTAATIADHLQAEYAKRDWRKS